MSIIRRGEKLLGHCRTSHDRNKEERRVDWMPWVTVAVTQARQQQRKVEVCHHLWPDAFKLLLTTIQYHIDQRMFNSVHWRNQNLAKEIWFDFLSGFTEEQRTQNIHFPTSVLNAYFTLTEFLPSCCPLIHLVQPLTSYFGFLLEILHVRTWSSFRFNSRTF